MSVQGTDLSDAAILQQTREWLERAVIGLNLCPFARAPYVQDRVRLQLSHATDAEELLADLQDALGALQAESPEVCETSLLIHPWALGDFLDFNDFLEIADACVAEMGLEGEIQIASFHPDYQFADTFADDIENFTNRAPFPTLHLLREASIERVVDAVENPDSIYQRNIETLRRLGADGWSRVLRGETEPGDA